MKPDERRTALGLNQSDDVGTNLVDHLGGHSRRNFVDRFHLEVERADPVRAAVGYHFEATSSSPDEMAAILAQDHELAAVVLLVDAELLHELDDPLLVLWTIFFLAEDCIHLGMVCENVGAVGPRLAIQGAGAQEQIFNVI